MPTKSLITKRSNSVDAYYTSSPIRRWEVSYGGDMKIYLTDAERDYFLKAINSGTKLVQLGELTLSSLIRYVIPVSEQNIPQDDDFARKVRAERERIYG